MPNELPPLRELRRSYRLGRWEQVKELHRAKNVHWRAKTDGGWIVVRRSGAGTLPKALVFEHELMERLRRAGIPTLETISSLEGLPYAEVGGRLFRITKKVEGRPARRGEMPDIAVVARLLAHYHRIVPSLRLSSTPTHLALREQLAGRIKLLSRPPLRRLAVRHSSNLPAVLDAGRRALAQLERYDELPQLVISGGWRLGSCFLDDRNRVACVMDFGSACRETRVLDLVISLLDAGKPGGGRSPSLDFAAINSFVAAYHTELDLEPLEEDLLFDVLLGKRVTKLLARYVMALEVRGSHSAVARDEARVQWLLANEDALRSALAPSIAAARNAG